MSAVSAPITIHERGVIEMPTAVYRTIRRYLPRSMQSVDPSDQAHRPTQTPLRHPRLDLVCDSAFLFTRAAWFIRAACSAASISATFRFEGMAGPLLTACRPTGLLLSTTISPGSDRMLDVCRAGQFVTRDLVHSLQVAAAIMAHFPSGQFLFPVATHQRAHALAPMLSQRIGEDVSVVVGMSPAKPRTRVVVGTYLSAAALVNHGPYGVMCVLQSGSLHAKLLDHLCVGEWPRLYVFRPHKLQLPRCDREELECRLGPPLACDLSLSLPDTDRVLMTPPEIYSVAFGGPACRTAASRPASSATPQRPRPSVDPHKAYVKHDGRNRLVASLADQLRHGGSEGETAPGEVVVVAYSAAHVRQIERWLPTTTTDDMTLRPLRIIALDDAVRSDRLNPAWLIFAAGNPPSNWLKGWIEQRAKQLQPVKIVDLTDEFEPATAQLAQARFRAYAKLRSRRRQLPKAMLKMAWRAASGRPAPLPTR